MLPTRSPSNAGAEIERQRPATGGYRDLNGCHGEPMVPEPLGSLQEGRRQGSARNDPVHQSGSPPQMAGWRVVIRSASGRSVIVAISASFVICAPDFAQPLTARPVDGPRLRKIMPSRLHNADLRCLSNVNHSIETARRRDFARQARANSPVAFLRRGAEFAKARDGIGRRD